MLHDPVAIEHGKRDVDPLQLSLGVQPGAVNPDKTEGQAEIERPGVPVLNNGDGTREAEA